MPPRSTADIAQRARETGRLGIDTEFMGEGRYQPLLCLAQIALDDGEGGAEVIVLDPLTEQYDPAPLAEVLADPAIEIVLHAARQDVAILRRAWSTTFENVFDTRGDVFLIAATGLLDGAEAATHWRYAAQLAERHPEITVNADVLYVDHGRVLTSAGSAAGLDLCLHIVRRDHGAAVANRVARRSVVAPWRDGGQSQFMEPLPDPSGPGTAPTRAWALEDLGRPLGLADMAAHASMSVRTFSRRFRDETGLSPARWLTMQRVALARRLLETTDLPVERVAADAGFGTATSMRLHLHAAIGVSPLAYRRTYRGDGVGAQRDQHRSGHVSRPSSVSTHTRLDTPSAATLER